jgi:cold shock CspA family protein
MPSFTAPTATNASYASTVVPASATATTAATAVTAVTAAADSVSGCVKWFNNKAGYGFITVTDRDIFVHHTAIQVNQSQYRYLVQGEYVELEISHVENDSHEYQSSNVRGVNGGKLMCETRNEMRAERQQGSTVAVTATRPARRAPEHREQQREQYQHREQQQQHREHREHREHQQQHQHDEETSGRRPQLSKSDQTEWMIVPKRRTDTRPSPVHRSEPHATSRRPQQRQPKIELE